MSRHEPIDEIELDEQPTNTVLEATCQACGTPTRFSTSGDYTIGEAFDQHCLSCTAGQHLVGGEVTTFRVTDLDPSLDEPAVSPHSPPIYSPNE